MAHWKCGGGVQWAWLSMCALFSPLRAIMRGGGDDDHGGGGGGKKEQCLVNMMAKQILFAIIHHK